MIKTYSYHFRCIVSADFAARKDATNENVAKYKAASLKLDHEMLLSTKLHL